MDRARGIDVIAVILVVLVVAELIGVLVGQQLIWASRAVRSPVVPSVLVLLAVVFGLEGVIKRRSEGAMLSRVVTLLIVAVALPVAAILGRAFGVYTPSHPVG